MQVSWNDGFEHDATSTGLVWPEKMCTFNKTISFIGAGEQAAPVKISSGGILNSARDWKLLVDLEKQLKFLSPIAVTFLLLGIILVSEVI